MIKIKSKNSKPAIEIIDPKGEIAAKFDFYIKIVIGILVIAMLTMIIMVSTIIIDSFHINSATYKEYSDKINNQNTLLEINKNLLEQNRQNQQILLEILKKK